MGVKQQKHGNVGIGTAAPTSTLTITGNFSATGTKSAVVNKAHGMRKLYAMESPDMGFYDKGRTKLKNGMADISLDSIFIETIEPEIAYNVYLPPEAKTQCIYVDEKADSYFIVKSYDSSSNVPFSWLISSYRKGYGSKRFDSGSDMEIVATIDAENKLTNVELKGNVVENANNAVKNKKSNSITGNLVSDVSLQTDLSKILEPASSTTTSTTQTNNTSTNTTSTAVVDFVENNSNATGENKTNNQTTSTILKQTEEQKNNVENKITQTLENKFTINSADENEVIDKIKEKTKTQ